MEIKNYYTWKLYSNAQKHKYSLYGIECWKLCKNDQDKFINNMKTYDHDD